MIYVVCYDISDDRTRNQMSECLLDFGVRVQESVFECVLDGYGFVRMIEAVNKVPIEDSDRLRSTSCARIAPKRFRFMVRVKSQMIPIITWFELLCEWLSIDYELS